MFLLVALTILITLISILIELVHIVIVAIILNLKRKVVLISKLELSTIFEVGSYLHPLCSQNPNSGIRAVMLSTNKIYERHQRLLGKLR